MRGKLISALIIACYGIPWVFLGMMGDYHLGHMWLYFLGLGVMLALNRCCRKTKRFRVVLAGNLLSLAVSCLATYLIATEQWNYFFKAFPATIRTVQFSCIFIILQLVPWWIRKVTE